MTPENCATALAAVTGGQSAVAVSVVGTQGSAPRGLDATLVVTPDGLGGSVGGGVLEHVAIQRARRWLEQGRTRPGLWAFPLSPDSQQCCGGVVVLAFEVYRPEDRDVLEALRRARVEWCTALALDGSAPSRLLSIDGQKQGPAAPGAVARWWQDAGHRDAGLVEHDGTPFLCRRLADPRLSVALFGAGHVGQALIQALALQQARVQWFDGRADAFPSSFPDAVEHRVSEDVDACLAAVPAGSHVRIMTHRHPLDYAICRAALSRQDLASVGLIGSASKRRRFVKALQRDGLSPDRAEALICPIGLPGLLGKTPAVIAASVVAELLIAHQGPAESTGRRSGISEAQAAASPVFLAD